jgi:hypothetical protein
MAYAQSGYRSVGWLFRVIDPNSIAGLFRGWLAYGRRPLGPLLQTHSDVDGENIEAVGPVSGANVLEFEVGARKANRYTLSKDCITL